MSRLSSWKDFAPSLTFCAVGQLRDLVEAAYKQASPEMEAAIQNSADPTVSVDGAFDASGAGAAGPNRWLNFGHQPEANGGLWSNSLPYRLTAEFDVNSELTKVSLNIFLANPHFSVGLTDFLPAKYVDQGAKVELLSESGGRIGIALLSGLGDPAEQAEIYRKLADGLPSQSFAAPRGFLDHSETTLLGRIDLNCVWPKSAEKHLGKWIGIPAGNPLEAAGPILRLSLYSSATTEKVDALVHHSKKFVLRLPQSGLSTPTVILAAPKKPGSNATPTEKAEWALYRATIQEFGLNDGFKGFLFKGLEGSWLEDDLSVSQGKLNAALDVAAVSFGDAKIQDGKDVIAFYVGMSLSVENHPNSTNPQRPFLGWFTAPASLRISIGQNGLRYLTLEGSFAQLDEPYTWFSGRSFSISVIKTPWKDNAGTPQVDWGIELGLEKTDDKFLARIPMEGNDVLSSAVIALSFAPIIFMFRTPPDSGGKASDAKSRGYFVNVKSAESVAAVFAAVSLKAFLKERVTVEELRITAVHLRNQPALINNPKAKDERETALLLDYDVDYTVNMHEAGLTTKRSITSHVDGTGFVVGDKSARWVQVPTGAYELGLSDPGLWDLGPLGTILKIADIRLRKEEHVSLVLQLQLARNFGGVKCDDFEISIDLESGQVKFEAFPAEIQVEIGKVFKGRGVLRIGESNGERDVTGAIDLAFVSLKWRVYGVLRITHVKDDAGERHVALAAGLEVEWPTKIPLLNTGLGLSGLQLIYATHFMRKEGPKVGSIPPALAWLKKAGGDVPMSIEKPPCWVAKYGHWTIGVGVEAGLMASDTININALLAFEEPGPRILVFVKVTLLQSPKPNKGNSELTGGILGVLDINWEEQTITVAVLAKLNFGKLVDFDVPIEFGASMIQLSRWHAYFGHFKSPIAVDLKIFTQMKAGATGYLMFDGFEIVGVPRENSPPDKTLPGFAITFGLQAGVHIGFDSLYIDVSFTTFVDLSLSRVFYAEGAAVLTGTLHIWRFDVGGSGRWDFRFLRHPDDGATEYKLKGSVCGYIKIWHRKISGCVGLSIGSDIADSTSLDELIRDVFLVSGAQAILFGQGAFDPIDAAFGKATVGPTPAPEPLSGLDSIIVLGMAVPPEVATAGTQGFASYLPQPTSNAVYQLGTKKGKYTIQGVTLAAKQADGSLVPVSYADCPARWWRNVAKQEGGQPSPLNLALLTRNPLGFENAILSPGEIGGPLDQLLDGLCRPSVPEQYAMYFIYPTAQYDLEHGACAVRGVLGDLDSESNPGYRAVTDLTVQLNVRAADISISVQAVNESIDGTQVPGVALHEFRSGDSLVNPTITFSANSFWRERLLQVCLALPPEFDEDKAVRLVTLLDRNGPVQLDKTKLTVVPLNSALNRFHEGKTHWAGAATAFSRLNEIPRYAAHRLWLLTIDLKGLLLTEDPTDLVIALDRDLPAGRPRTIVIGPAKFTPSAEHNRFIWDEARKQALQQEVQDYVSKDDKPLLEPDTEYVLTITYSEMIDGASKQHSPVVRSFKTSPRPPRKLDPYLLATYPSGSAAHNMPLGDLPALLLPNYDILQILEKYAVDIKISITHDGGASVMDSTSTLNWSTGGVFRAAELRQGNPPKGIITASHPGWPSATKDAILKRIEDGDLPCINANLSDRALWIGFDVILHSLSGYHVRLDLVDGNGDPVFADDPTGASTEFYSFSFTTGLYKSMSELADRSANGNLSRRIVTKVPEFDVVRVDPQFPNLEIIPDKSLEDAIATVAGERQAYSGEPDYCIFWKHEDQALHPSAVWIRANEPILLNSVLPKIGEVTGVDGTTSRLLGEEVAPVWGPKQEANGALPVGVSRFVIAESGLTAIVVLDANAGSQDLELKLQRVWSWQLGDNFSEERTLLKIPASMLRARAAKLPATASGRV